jgi:arylsulfatase A-like enzyme
MKQMGYRHVHWYGKWHVGNTPQDYGFQGWVPPDAGNYLSLNDTLGGGEPNNDGRFLEEVTKFLTTTTRRQSSPRNREPFCLVASFVNPHDVYVAQHEPALGYTPKDFSRINVPLPSNYMEDPDQNNKPRAQGQMSFRYVPFENSPQDYVNFYGFLHTVVDARIGALLDVLDDLDLTNSTLILRTADHGEQALSHSLVEKFYNCYQESIHIPFVVSNPIAFPTPQSTTAFTSHVDILPTLFQLGRKGKQEESFAGYWKGKDLMPLLEDPQSTNAMLTIKGDANEPRLEEVLGVQPHIHFTYDDISCPGAPSIVRCICTTEYKYAVYFTPDGLDADWELYDLSKDPKENVNLAGDPNYLSVQKQLDQELQRTMTDMGTMPTEFHWPPSASPQSRGADQPMAEERR